MSLRIFDEQDKKFMYAEFNAESLYKLGMELYGYALSNLYFDVGSGIKDQNGKEIYDNDIVMVRTEDDNYELCHIKFEDGCFFAWNEYGFNSPIMDCLVEEGDNIILMGNKYENDHLTAMERWQQELRDECFGTE